MFDIYDPRNWPIGIVPIGLTVLALRYTARYVRAGRPFDNLPDKLRERNVYRASLAPESAMLAIALEQITVRYFNLEFIPRDTFLVGILTVAYGVVGAFFIESFIKFSVKSKCVTAFDCLLHERPHIKIYGIFRSPIFTVVIIMFAAMIFWLLQGQVPSPKRNMHSIYLLLLGQFETGFLFLFDCLFSTAIYTGILASIAASQNANSDRIQSKSNGNQI